MKKDEQMEIVRSILKEKGPIHYRAIHDTLMEEFGYTEVIRPQTLRCRALDNDDIIISKEKRNHTRYSRSEVNVYDIEGGGEDG